MHPPSHNLKATMGSNNNNTTSTTNNPNTQTGSGRPGAGLTIFQGYDESAPPPKTSRVLFCMECYDPQKELLEYDYTKAKLANGDPQPYPRIRDRGEYYIDTYNDQPWSWTFGTHEKVR